MDAACLFISYRRQDSAGYARALHEALSQVYGQDRVFIDVEDINAGQRFVDVISQALRASAVLLVLIGPRWAGPLEGAPARLHDPQDLVRREVEAGLARNLHLVPVLLDGTPMPAVADLPASLHPLLQRQALHLGSQGFKSDLAQLLAALQPHLGDAAEKPSAPRPSTGRKAAQRRTAMLGGTLLVLTAAGAGAWWWARGPRAADFTGTWQAQVTYPWPNAVYQERFNLRLDGHALAGSASFLRVPRVIGDVQLDDMGLRFTTRTTSVAGTERWTDLHRYRVQRLADGGLSVEMQTESDGVLRRPLRFVAQPAAAEPPR